MNCSRTYRSETASFFSAFPTFFLLLCTFCVLLSSAGFSVSEARDGSSSRREQNSSTKDREVRKSYQKLKTSIHSIKNNLSRRPPTNSSETLMETFITFENSLFHEHLEAASPKLYSRIEEIWLNAKGQLQKGNRKRGKNEIKKLLALLEQGFKTVETSRSPTLLFVHAFNIILREGFEAILILGALIALVMKMGQSDLKTDIYLGTGGALVATLLLAVAAETFLNVTGEARELLEGITMLIAVVVLFMVSHWLMSTVSGGKWMELIKEKVKKATTRGSRLTLIGLSFLVVFREGFETVLFYKALSLRAADVSGGFQMISGGFLLGCLCLCIIYFLFTRYGIKIPTKPFFAVTSVLLYLLAFKFAGDGIKELQEAGTLEFTIATWVPSANVLKTWFGIHASWEGIIVQSTLLFAVLLGILHTFVFEPYLERQIQPSGHTERDRIDVLTRARNAGLKVFVPLVTFLFCGSGILAYYTSSLVAPPKTKPDNPGEPNSSVSLPVDRKQIPPRYRNKTNPLSASPKTYENGRKLYNKYCRNCHGENGRGNGVDGRNLTPPPKDFHKNQYLQNHSDPYLFFRISEGKPETTMPGWQGVLSEKQRWALVHYIRKLGNDSENDRP